LPEAQVPRSFALSPERAAVPRPAAPLAFGARIAAAGVAVALAAVLVVDLGDLGGGGATEEVSAPQTIAEREADEGGMGAAGAAAPEPYGTPAAPEAAAEDAGVDFMNDTTAGETPAAGPDEAPVPAVPSDGGIEALTAAEIALAAALGVLVAGSLALAFAGRKR
jgi:hypothetical protein